MWLCLFTQNEKKAQKKSDTILDCNWNHREGWLDINFWETNNNKLVSNNTLNDNNNYFYIFLGILLAIYAFLTVILSIWLTYLIYFLNKIKYLPTTYVIQGMADRKWEELKQGCKNYEMFVLWKADGIKQLMLYFPKDIANIVFDYVVTDI